MHTEPDRVPSSVNRSSNVLTGCSLYSLHLIWICLAAIGLYYAYVSWQFISNGVKVDAIVVEMDTHSDSDGTSYSPIFEYAYEGKTYRYNSVNSSNPPTHRVGDHTVLLVNPENPEKARENSFWELWLLPAIMLPVSCGTGIGMTLLTFFVRRAGRVTSKNYQTIDM